jgi:hypothetical protein
MKTQSIRLKVIDCIQYPGCSKRFIASCFANDLKGVEFPLDANVRRPTRNNVVKSMLADAKEYASRDERMVVPASLFFVCEEVKLSRTNSGVFVDLFFGNGQGLADGAHKSEFARITNLDPGTYRPENIFLGLDIEIIKEKEKVTRRAVALNNSQNPTALDLVNARGELDEFKSIFDGSKFRFIHYMSGKLPAGFDGNPTCKASRIFLLPTLLNKKYDPAKVGELNRDRHPMFLANNTGNGSTKRESVLRANTKYSKKFWLDCVELYCDIFKALDKSHDRVPLPFIRSSSNQLNRTHLPDGTILRYKHPVGAYIAPIMSCFRVVIDSDGEFPEEWTRLKESLIRSLISETRYIVKRREYSDTFLSIIHRDVYPWDRLWRAAEATLDKETTP